jgi:cysteine desulfurase
MIYLDHAATTPVHPDVAKAVYDVMNNHHGNPSSMYSVGREAKDLLEKAREQVAGLICADPEEMFFTS